MAILSKTRYEEPAFLKWFDGAQLCGIMLAACLLNLDLFTGKNGIAQIETRLLTLHLRNVILATALAVRSIRRQDQSRRLYAPVLFAFSLFTLSSWVSNQAIDVWGMEPGGWCDLGWSVPLASLAIAAGQWVQAKRRVVEDSTARPTLRWHDVTEFLLPPCLSVSVIALALVGMSLSPWIGGALIFASILCLSARSSFAQCYQRRLVDHLHAVLENTKRLSGYLAVCSACRMVRDEASGGWRQWESYVREHSEAEFTHGICPECAQRLYPDHLTVSGD